MIPQANSPPPHPMAKDGVCSKAVGLLLLIPLFIVAPDVCALFVAVLCLVIVLFFCTLCSSRFAITLMGVERVGCFALTVFLMSYDSECSLALPRGAVGWCAVCDCIIS